MAERARRPARLGGDVADRHGLRAARADHAPDGGGQLAAALFVIDDLRHVFVFSHRCAKKTRCSTPSSSPPRSPSGPCSSAACTSATRTTARALSAAMLLAAASTDLVVLAGRRRSTSPAARPPRPRTSSPPSPSPTPSSTRATSSRSPTASSCAASAARWPSRRARRRPCASGPAGTATPACGRSASPLLLRRLPARRRRGDALAAAAGIWTAILAIDFLVSFSYSVGGSQDRERQLRLGREATGPAAAIVRGAFPGHMTGQGAMTTLARGRLAASLPSRSSPRGLGDLAQPPRHRSARQPVQPPLPRAPPSRPGVFMRASEPSPSTSCICTIATRAGEAWASRISDQCGSRSRTPAASIASASTSTRTDRGQRRRTSRSTVSLSCVPV